jgi:RHS repeat-associated protein
MKKAFTLITLLFFSNFLFSQELHQAESFQLGSPNSGNQIYEASQYIQLMAGFSYVPQANESFTARIDPYLIFPPTGGETGGPDVGDDGVVGAINGAFNVSPSGAATYTIPIEVPSGIAGMQPSLSLAYNSQGGNGFLGYGWSLGGMSSISVIGKSIYHDGENKLPIFNAWGSDPSTVNNVALDGQRLILITQDLQSTTYEYRTEVGSFTKIIGHRYGLFTTDFIWFEIYTKEGLIMEYGNTTDSKSPSLTWLLNKVTDRKGNYIKYTYYNNSATHEFYPQSIEYTGNTGQNILPYYRIDFNVMPRIDINKKFFNAYDKSLFPTSYLHSDSIFQNVVLESIKIYYQNSATPLKEYNLNYSSNPSIHLNSVTLKSNSEKLNSTKFIWGAEKPEMSTQTAPGIQNYYDDANGKRHYGNVKQYADYNGDGLSDVVVAYYWVAADNTHVYDKWKLFVNKGKANNYSFEFASEGDLMYQMIFIGFTPLDYDGDGRMDLVINYKNYPGSGEQGVTYVGFLHSTGNSFQFFYPPNEPYITATDCLAADFDGDGRSELLFIYKNAASGVKNINLVRVSSTTGSTKVSYTIISSFELYINSLDKLSSNQLSGDGKGELTIVRKGSFAIFDVYAFSKINSNPEQYVMMPQAEILSLKLNTKEFWGDLNGDGINDVLTWDTDLNKWSIGLFDGTTFHTILCPITLPYDTTYGNADLVTIGDFNGDGKGDIIHQHNTGSGSIIDIYYYYGAGFHKESQTTTVYADSHSDFLDFNGDGKEDLASLLYSYTSPITFFSFHPNENSNFIEEIKTGLGVSTKIEYDQLTDPTIYTKQTNAIYPIIDMSGALTVVKGVSIENGLGGYNTTSYKYAGAKAHMQGKGFLGFSQVTVTDDVRHLVSNIYNNIDPTFYFLYPQISTNYFVNGSTNQLLNTTTNIYTIKDLGNKRFFPYMSSSISQSKDFVNTYLGTNKTVVTYNEADVIHGNVTSTKTLTDEDQLDINAPDTDFGYISSNEFQYETADETNWIVSRVKSKTTKSNVPYAGSSEISRTTGFEYYPIGSTDYPLLSKTINFSGEKLLWEQYWYDGVGNMIKTKVSAPNSTDPDITPRETNYEYSDTYNKRFLTKTFNKASDLITLTQETIYYPETGLPKESLDANNLKTSYFYDSFNRLQKKVNPNGVIESSIFQWKKTETGMPVGTVFYTWTGISGSSPVISYFDKYGRELGTLTKAFDNTTVLSEKSYDKLGRLEYIYEPNDKTKFTQNKFNGFGQIEQVINPDLTTLSYAYSGRTTTTQDILLHTQTKKVNALGWVEESTDAKGQSVKYEYLADGQVRRTYLAGVSGSDIINTYDPVTGKQATTTDPDAGIIEYTYNAYGELVEQKQIQSATKTVESTFKYDVLGRNIEKTNIEEGTTKTEYDTKANGKGLIAKVENTTLGHTIEYEYDPMCRVSKQKEKIDGVIYTTAIEYDAFGRQIKTDYPYIDGTQPVLTVSQKYDFNGFLVSITNETEKKLLWQLTEMNNKGQIKKYALGNGLQTQQEYYPLTGLPYTTKTFNSTNRIQDMEYGWDNIGNLSYRKKWLDAAHSLYLNEGFTYDELNRLDITKLNGAQTSDMNYQPTGNIDSKTGLGSYTYAENGAGIHAVTSVDNTSNLTNTESQTITYSPFNKVNHISQGGNKTLDIWYGMDQQRLKQTSVIDGVITTKIFVGGVLEKVNSASGNNDYYFISAPTGICAVYVKPFTGATYTRYIHTDHLGSVNCITNEIGQLVQEYSFDAWGNCREPSTWKVAITALPSLFCDRGFTGHEHLEAFGLINMNGRVYDPVLGRLLSPDNYVQSPLFSQSFNRYSYCLNNPLVYTDPDGNNPLLIAAFLGGVFNVLTHMDQIHGMGDFATAFGIGAIAGLAGGAFGHAAAGIFRNAFINGAITAGAGYASSIGISAMGNGAYFNDPMPSLKQFGVGMGISMLSGGISAGLRQDFSAKRGVSDIAQATKINSTIRKIDAYRGTGYGMSYVGPDDPTMFINLPVTEIKDIRIGHWAHILSFLDVTIAAGGVGYTLSWGVMTDSYGKTSQFISYGLAIGGEASISTSYTAIPYNNVTLDQMTGNSIQGEVNLPFVKLGGGGVTDIRYGEVSSLYGSNYAGGKVGVGFGVGASVSFPKTVLLPDFPKYEYHYWRIR